MTATSRVSRLFTLFVLLCCTAAGCAATPEPQDVRKYLVTPTLLWPSNIMSGELWAGQGLTKDELIAVLNRRLPPVDESNRDKSVYEVLSETACRAIVFVPSVSEKRGKLLLDTPYGDQKAGAKPPTVGFVLGGLVTGWSEIGGPREVNWIGALPPDVEEGTGRPQLVYAVYVTKEYITVVALPTDGG